MKPLFLLLAWCLALVPLDLLAQGGTVDPSTPVDWTYSEPIDWTLADHEPGDGDVFKTIDFATVKGVGYALQSSHDLENWTNEQFYYGMGQNVTVSLWSEQDLQNPPAPGDAPESYEDLPTYVTLILRKVAGQSGLLVSWSSLADGSALQYHLSSAELAPELAWLSAPLHVETIGDYSYVLLNYTMMNELDELPGNLATTLGAEDLAMITSFEADLSTINTTVANGHATAQNTPPRPPMPPGFATYFRLSSDWGLDSDNDQLPDWWEWEQDSGIDPFNPDSDGDGLTDGQDPAPDGDRDDIDGDGVPNHLDAAPEDRAVDWKPAPTRYAWIPLKNFTDGDFRTGKIAKNGHVILEANKKVDGDDVDFLFHWDGTGFTETAQEAVKNDPVVTPITGYFHEVTWPEGDTPGSFSPVTLSFPSSDLPIGSGSGHDFGDMTSTGNLLLRKDLSAYFPWHTGFPHYPLGAGINLLWRPGQKAHPIGLDYYQASGLTFSGSDFSANSIKELTGSASVDPVTGHVYEIQRAISVDWDADGNPTEGATFPSWATTLISQEIIKFQENPTAGTLTELAKLAAPTDEIESVFSLGEGILLGRTGSFQGHEYHRGDRLYLNGSWQNIPENLRSYVVGKEQKYDLDPTDDIEPEASLITINASNLAVDNRSTSLSSPSLTEAFANGVIDLTHTGVGLPYSAHLNEESFWINGEMHTAKEICPALEERADGESIDIHAFNSSGVLLVEFTAEGDEDENSEVGLAPPVDLREHTSESGFDDFERLLEEDKQERPWLMVPGEGDRPGMCELHGWGALEASLQVKEGEVTVTPDKTGATDPVVMSLQGTGSDDLAYVEAAETSRVLDIVTYPKVVVDVKVYEVTLIRANGDRISAATPERRTGTKLRNLLNRVYGNQCNVFFNIADENTEIEVAYDVGDPEGRFSEYTGFFGANLSLSVPENRVLNFIVSDDDTLSTSEEDLLRGAGWIANAAANVYFLPEGATAAVGPSPQNEFYEETGFRGIAVQNKKMILIPWAGYTEELKILHTVAHEIGHMSLTPNGKGLKHPRTYPEGEPLPTGFPLKTLAMDRRRLMSTAPNYGFISGLPIPGEINPETEEPYANLIKEEWDTIHGRNTAE